MKLFELLKEAKEDFIANALHDKLLSAYNNDNSKPPLGTNVTALQIVNHLAAISKSYLQWVAKQYATGQFKWEDFADVRQDLVKFADLVKTDVVTNKDINTYPTLNSLRLALSDNTTSGGLYHGKIEKLYMGLVRAVKQGHGEWLLNNNDDPVKIYVPTDANCSLLIRKLYPDIKWCTTRELKYDPDFMYKVATDLLKRDGIDVYDSDDMIQKYMEAIEIGKYDKYIAANYDTSKLTRPLQTHDRYIRDYGGELYVIITPEGLYQFHMESNEYTDERDDKINPNQLVQKYPVIKRILSKRRALKR